MVTISNKFKAIPKVNRDLAAEAITGLLRAGRSVRLSKNEAAVRPGDKTVDERHVSMEYLNNPYFQTIFGFLAMVAITENGLAWVLTAFKEPEIDLEQVVEQCILGQVSEYSIYEGCDVPWQVNKGVAQYFQELSPTMTLRMAYQLRDLAVGQPQEGISEITPESLPEVLGLLLQGRVKVTQEVARALNAGMTAFNFSYFTYDQAEPLQLLGYGGARALTLNAINASDRIGSGGHKMEWRSRDIYSVSLHGNGEAKISNRLSSNRVFYMATLAKPPKINNEKVEIVLRRLAG